MSFTVREMSLLENSDLSQNISKTESNSNKKARDFRHKVLQAADVYVT